MSSQGSEKSVSANARKIVLWGALGFLLLGAITGIPAVIWGHRALHGRNRDLYSELDRKVIVGGMVLGYLGNALSVLLIVLILAAILG